ncbi:Uncharacterised protein [Bordetella pertussis]|nr:Uncharacterised protein [Bordetella pertussis]CPL34584.1 Uncharacterised protein [Bordetella pertussis]CRD69052.1 Uncharacterised protein [Bordetella pertussis]CRD73053.1 Uncharacterised protein [Bordetella pertussis]
MQGRDVGMAFDRIQRRRAQGRRAFLHRRAGPAAGARQPPGRHGTAQQQGRGHHQRGGRNPGPHDRGQDGAARQRHRNRRQHEQEHRIQRVDVAGQPRHQVAAAVARQLARRQAHQRAEYRGPQIGQQAQRGGVAGQPFTVARGDADERQAAHQRRRHEQIEHRARAGQRRPGQEPARHPEQAHARRHGQQRQRQGQRQRAFAARVQAEQ